MMSNYSDAVSKAMETYKDGNEISDWTKSKTELNNFYKNTLRNAYLEANGEKAPDDITMTELA
jgi:hypothetical protein